MDKNEDTGVWVVLRSKGKCIRIKTVTVVVRRSVGPDSRTVVERRRREDLEHPMVKDTGERLCKL